MNNPQKLGIKVFYYYLSRKISLGVILLVVSFIVSSSKDFIVSKMVMLLPVSVTAVVVNFLTSGLFIISAVFILGAFVTSWFKYTSCDFSLDENAFNIRRGFFTKKEISIPYRQIQNVNIEQSISHKMLGIGKLVILTEGDHSENNGEASGGSFDVIDYVLAHKVREFILQRANFQIVKDSTI
ncbi:MAG: Membrane-flanked domain-containing protein [Candidatus Nomurabacteria bacterium GW2011_GWF2_35_66]|uniref:Membrane-flanked domain-containing protein n=1 Tax=Candidatus Nomurabacteria bacterium GW2011_GWE1_35_16 TaxID=1618761 RepID=A0A0G0B9F3_9BACT|nr:MAG: Membrane-flanked domain-containing protein [Candidatus Nomurabacteria bacterium GW2011_GWF1_34_20]KKP62082.1 MAG: Membrane-flanked domain-containing protein [Candidatus Nomurabacteria bacterium GW2011_GWE2_34_25]KKP66048.1 MAG: Membrane-flanked domain-containing protein [Candidatus Nomurabacteria bacterium GW2011_GWE1_35_16]KKP83046.1 MAG: Membrane-flanked domain-containing protein [Candidatus Nomurabacteria bacterium GW2011_GWF2_35_66]HAE36956.1 hypothetical protein [Candidatus Nomurab